MNYYLEGALRGVLFAGLVMSLSVVIIGGAWTVANILVGRG